MINTLTPCQQSSTGILLGPGQGDRLWKINAYSGKQTSVTHRCHLLAHATEPIADSGNSDDYTSDAGLEED